ncbi:hypothetical protein KUC_1188 [Vreelandella boliviensis LC1]|uniref:Uncharacterized protein n=1 Tax=Vreelandella boliviensis LC1 TaxID=1072583 RepID=A0A7U9GIQ8_9GAMM|nr:hypothetical protein KUC_1188 [Halomonas boliviensis LC1]
MPADGNAASRFSVWFICVSSMLLPHSAKAERSAAYKGCLLMGIKVYTDNFK